jgi:tetratricopeptide (TPR) repeat protein
MFEDDDASMGEEQLDEKKDALQKYEEMIKNRIDLFFDVDTLGLIIDAYFENNKYNQAFEACNYALKLHPTQHEFILRQASLLSKLGNDQSALEKLNTYEKLNPHNPDLYLIRANILIAQNEFDKAIDNYLQAINYNQDPAPIYHDLSFAYADSGNFNSAIKYMKMFLQSGWQDTLAYDQLINWLIITSRLESEVSFFQNQIDNDPYNDAAWLAFGMVNKELKLYDKALHAFEYCLLIANDNIQGYLEQGDVYFILEQYESAIKSYENSLEYFPGNAITYYNIGECFERLDNFEKAREHYTRAIRLYPDLAAAWYSIGMVLSYQDKMYEAIHYLKKAVELEPTNAEFWFALADCESSLNHFNEAIACYENVIDLEPDNEEIYAEYALFLFENHQLDDAIETIQMGIKTLPQNAEHYYYAACFFYADAKLQMAYEEFEQGLIKNFESHKIIFDVLPLMQNDHTITELILRYSNTN